MAKFEYALDHIDPEKGRLVCGLDDKINLYLMDWYENHKKLNRFVPYRIDDRIPVHQAPGDWGFFLISGEWKLTQFMGSEWWEESEKIGHNLSSDRQSKRGKVGGAKGKGRPNSKTQNKKIGESKIGKSRPAGLMSKVGKASSKSDDSVNKILYRCTITGKITTSGPLTGWQRARGIDTSNRVKVI